MRIKIIPDSRIIYKSVTDFQVSPPDLTAVMAQDCVRNSRPKGDVKKFCNVNVGGIDYKISMNAMSSVPGSRLHQIAKDNKYCDAFERPRAAFESILAYHQTGQLHMPGNLCPGAFKQEMKFWGVNPHLMENCCYHRYVTFLKDQDIMNGFLAKKVQKEEKLQAFLTDKSTRIARLRARMWSVLDNRDDAIVTKIYFSVATAFILIAIFTTALGTLSNTNIKGDTNTTSEPGFQTEKRNNSIGYSQAVDSLEDAPPNVFLHRKMRRSISENVYLDKSLSKQVSENTNSSEKEHGDRLVNKQRPWDNTRKNKNKSSVQYRGGNIEKHQLEIETTHPQGNIEKQNVGKCQQGTVQKHQQLRTENYQIKQFRQHQRLHTNQQQGRIANKTGNTQKIQRMNSERHQQESHEKYHQVQFGQGDFVNEVGSERYIKMFRDILDKDKLESNVKGSDRLIITNTFYDDLRNLINKNLLSQMQNEPSQDRNYIRVSRSLTSTVENKTTEYENVTENVGIISRSAENITKPVEKVTLNTNDKDDSIFNQTNVTLDGNTSQPYLGLIFSVGDNITVDVNPDISNGRVNAKDVIDNILPETPTSKVRTMETASDEGQLTYIYVEYTTNVFFTCELCFRILFCPRALKYLFSFQNITDMLVLAAVYTREIVSRLGTQGHQDYIDILLYLQMFRVLRLLRLLENVTAYKVLCYAMRVGKKDIFLIVLYVFFGVLFFSNFIYFFERNEDFPSIPDAWWWSIVTITTVGYGDMVPKTFIGKIIGSVCALSGVFMFSLIIPIFVNTFLSIYQYAEIRNLNDALASKRNTKTRKNDNKEQSV